MLLSNNSFQRCTLKVKLQSCSRRGVPLLRWLAMANVAISLGAQPEVPAGAALAAGPICGQGAWCAGSL